MTEHRLCSLIPVASTLPVLTANAHCKFLRPPCSWRVDMGLRQAKSHETGRSCEVQPFPFRGGSPDYAFGNSCSSDNVGSDGFASVCLSSWRRGFLEVLAPPLLLMFIRKAHFKSGTRLVSFKHAFVYTRRKIRIMPSLAYF